MADFASIHIDPTADKPVYKQVSDAIVRFIERGILRPGDKLPPTRELAGLLGLNRTTISTAYTVLEDQQLIRGEVGRGSFVAHPNQSVSPPEPISFAASRPATEEFPLAAFRRLAKEVIDSPLAPEILQLGDVRGFGPLREFLQARTPNAAGEILITNGCQQALDLIARVFAGPGRAVLIEDPVYPGLIRTFARTGADLFGTAVQNDGVDVAAMERAIHRHQPAVIVLAPNFQNPTGACLPLHKRQRIANAIDQSGAVFVEVDLYGRLRYSGATLPSIRSLQNNGNSILVESYSKIAFPGLRVGWCLGPRKIISQLTAAKEISDLHSDQLAQAVVLRFAESGELDAHLSRTIASNGRKLNAALNACAAYLPAHCTWTKPEGGLNLWLELPPGTSADTVAQECRKHGVRFLPGRLFSVRGGHENALRISFGGHTPDEITAGLKVLGQVIHEVCAADEAHRESAAATALV